jgi:anti-sigma factor RsiW
VTTPDHVHDPCRRMLSQLSDYADDALAAELCAELESHLADCEHCRIVLDTLRKTLSLVRCLPDEEPAPLPPGVEQRLFDVLGLKEFHPGG